MSEFKAVLRRARARTVIRPPNEAHSGYWLEWIGAKANFGHGVIGLGGRKVGTGRVHRLVCTEYRGAPPEGFYAVHECATPSCVTPDCLSWKTAKGNSEDMVRHGRSTKKTHCSRNHEIAIHGRYESGACKPCARAASARRRQQNG